MGFSYGAAANSYALAAGLGMTPAALSAAAGSAALRGDTHQLAALLAAGQDVGSLNGFPGLNAAGSSNNMQVRARVCAFLLRLGLPAVRGQSRLLCAMRSRQVLEPWVVCQRRLRMWIGLPRSYVLHAVPTEASSVNLVRCVRKAPP